MHQPGPTDPACVHRHAQAHARMPCRGLRGAISWVPAGRVAGAPAVLQRSARAYRAPAPSAPAPAPAPTRPSPTPALPWARSPHTPAHPTCSCALQAQLCAQRPCPVTIQPPLYCDTILAPVLKPLLSRYKSCIVTQPTSPPKYNTVNCIVI